MEVDSFDIFRVCETKVWADPEYFVLGSLSGDRRIKTQPSKCRMEETPHSPTGRSRSSKENLGAAGHVVVTLFFE